MFLYMLEYKLPEVQEGTRFSVQRALQEDPEFGEKLVQRYGKENPQIMDWLASYVLSLPRECRKPSLSAALLTLRLVESQGEADSLNPEINRT